MSSVYAAARPVVTVHKPGDKSSQVALPAVFLSPIRSDLVRFVHTNMAKNSRQAYAVSAVAGHQTAARSWGTGRAVSRIPRVPGGGTHRAGQGAFGNMCRGGRMFAPTKQWRKWHRKINKNQKRYAVTSAIAASALPSLVLARGHRIEQLPEVPLVVEDSVIASAQKTKDARAVLQQLSALADVEKVSKSRKVRRGRGKARNRRYVKRRGPLIVYAGGDNQVVRGFRNLSGIESCDVSRLNLLQLAPGGHLGRFIIWTKSAFQALDTIYGNGRRPSTKKGFALPRSLMTNADLSSVINSDAVQSQLNAPKRGSTRRPIKKNPLTNLGVMVKLNPYALTQRRKRLLAEQDADKAKAAGNKKGKRAKKKTAAYKNQLLKL